MKFQLKIQLAPACPVAVFAVFGPNMIVCCVHHFVNTSYHFVVVEKIGWLVGSIKSELLSLIALTQQ